MAEDLTKATIRRETKKVLNRIVADEDKYEYQLIEDLLREKYPSYFRKRMISI
ncbi:MAG: hypothetical protein PHG06_00625 [Parabacteroides sp.]|nr:hypothetical protein [Parabacteroides sp.]